MMLILIFQFHKGTIKTVNIQTNTGRLMQFQFHKGTIKTISDFGTVVPNDISIP